MELTPASIRYAMDRLKDFESVHRGEDLSEKADAIGILMESLGIDDNVKLMLIKWLREFPDGDGYEGPFLLGVIIGALSFRYVAEKE